MSVKFSYCLKCRELAEYFLDGEPDPHTPQEIGILAHEIQDQIEQWLADRHHTHECQQCSKVVVEDCVCTKGQYMTWCSSNCRAAYDL